jgi:hypothetical protein
MPIRLSLLIKSMTFFQKLRDDSIPWIMAKVSAFPLLSVHKGHGTFSLHRFFKILKYKNPFHPKARQIKTAML